MVEQSDDIAAAVAYLTEQPFVDPLRIAVVGCCPRSRRGFLRGGYGPREDPDAIGEQRFITLGRSATGALLVVVFTHRERGAYRLISAWKANKRQRMVYEEERG